MVSINIFLKKLDYHTYNLFRLHTNVKFKAILKINIVNF
jgi:hypothetical protein